MFTEPRSRHEMLRSGWKSVGKVFILALVLDAVYQFITVRWFYPGEAIVVALILAAVPYLLLRGPVNRFMGRKGWAGTDAKRDPQPIPAEQPAQGRCWHRYGHRTDLLCFGATLMAWIRTRALHDKFRVYHR